LWRQLEQPPDRRRDAEARPVAIDVHAGADAQPSSHARPDFIARHETRQQLLG
jgi:hypothetical protein